jgi:hypothetical protein
MLCCCWVLRQRASCSTMLGTPLRPIASSFVVTRFALPAAYTRSISRRVPNPPPAIDRQDEIVTGGFMRSRISAEFLVRHFRFPTSSKLEFGGCLHSYPSRYARDRLLPFPLPWAGCILLCVGGDMIRNRVANTLGVRGL